MVLIVGCLFVGGCVGYAIVMLYLGMTDRHAQLDAEAQARVDARVAAIGRQEKRRLRLVA